MGCDGGTIPRRDEMVKLKKKAQKAERDVELMAKWRHCALSGEKLTTPAMGCELGRLYNKESVIMALLDKTNLPDIAKHIRSLKDVVELRLTPNPSYKPSEKADSYNDVQAAEYICPVSGLEMSGRYRFAFLRKCGCVFSEKALKEVPSESCHKCGHPFVKEDIVIINGSDEDIEKQREAMEERRKMAKLSKRKRKAEASQPSSDSAEASSSSSSSGSPPDSSASSEPPSEKKSKMVSASKPSKKLPKVSKSSPSASCRKQASGQTSKELEERDAYKSLFNSNAPARTKDQTSHWVTFFPYH